PRPHDPLNAATDRLLASLTAVLRGYHLEPGQEIHALRTVRSALHGYVTLEAASGFQYDTDIDDSFTWMITLIDRGLRTHTTR
ncbi:MAG: WHG domain-containing protein, partial [Actinomycetota bacterium]|nr:WHG domain-containing protein [Actinomycetota bacterium]